MRVIELLKERLDLESVVATAQAQLTHTTGFIEYELLTWPIEWAAEVSAGGGDFTPEMIAVVRRHQQLVKPAERKSSPEFAEPVLNAGEAWSDQVMAELPELGEDRRRLVDHAKTASGAKPSATWDRKATAMLAVMR